MRSFGSRTYPRSDIHPVAEIVTEWVEGHSMNAPGDDTADLMIPLTPDDPLRACLVARSAPTPPDVPS
jgi:hypothetical protein